MHRRHFLDLGLAAAAASLLPGEARAESGTLLQYTTQNLATPLERLDRLVVPTESLFVRSHFGPPALDPSRRLRITGLVDRPLELGLADLAKLEQVTVTAMLQCAENGRARFEPSVPGIQWGLGAMGQATFSGVRLATLLKEAGASAEAAHVRFGSADLPHKPLVPAFVRSIPMGRALDPTTIVATHMNGEPLGLLHGAPMRLVVPGWAGHHWIKWLTEAHVQKEEAGGYFMTDQYRMPEAPGADPLPITTFPVGSVIANPTEGARKKPGPEEIRGVAFSGGAAITRVEVSLDGGASFSAAKLEGEAGPGRWQVFRFSFVAKKPGPYRALVRATDKSGKTQPKTPAWNPGGYLWNGWHEVRWEVEP